MLNIKKELSGTTMNLALEGLLDTTTAPQLEEALMADLSDVNEIHFDFANLEYLTSAGLRIILVAQQEMEDKDGEMTLKNVSDDIMEIFDMTGFSDVLTFV